MTKLLRYVTSHWYVVAILFLLSATGALVQTKHASAGYGNPPICYGYFTNKCFGFSGYTNVIADGVPASSSKTTFENYILARHNSTRQSATYNDGGGTEVGGYKVGADFVIQTMRGGTDRTRPTASDVADWQNRLANPAVTISVQSYTTSGPNSGYHSGDIAWVDTPQSGTALIFKVNGTPVYIIRTSCGNPLGVTKGLPAYDANNAPTGSLSFSCTGGGQLTMRVSDADGATAGYATSGGVTTGTPHASGFVYGTSSQTGWNSETYTLYAKDVGPGGSGRYEVVSRKTVARCGVLSCGTSTFPAAVAAGQPVNFTVGARYSPTNIGAPTGARFDVTIKNSAKAVVYQKAGQAAAAAGGGTITSPVQTWKPATADSYTLTWTYGGTAISVSCPPNGTPPTAQVAYEPYFNVLGGDINAGSKVVGNGTCSQSADIKAWNNNNTGGTGYFGAGAQLASFATGQMNGFVSGTGNAAVGNGTTLSFTNTSASGTNYGGAWDGSACVPDYAGTAAGSATPGGTTNINLSALASGTYSYASSVQLSGTLAAGRTVTIVVTGNGHNAIITGDINYDSYSDIASIPRLNIYVQNGDVAVTSDVDHIHGFFVAQGNGTVSGRFISCADGSGTPVDLNDGAAYDTCNHQLTIYGAVSAYNMVLNRTYGNLSAVSGVPATPAEVFQYTPELWLAPDRNSTGGSANNFTAITSLPPVL